jgi:hypothetical protein
MLGVAGLASGGCGVPFDGVDIAVGQQEGAEGVQQVVTGSQ